MMKIQVRTNENISILDISGSIDIDSAEIIEVTCQLLRYKNTDILFNFEEVESIDYNGLSILVIAYKNILNHGYRARFCNISMQVIGLLKVAHLDSIFEIYPNEKAAIKSFNEAISQVEKKALRRRFDRLDVRITVTHSLFARPEVSYEGKVLNISGSGMYIYSKDTFPMNAKLKLQLNLPGINGIIDVRGIVVWGADREIQPHASPGMGVEFRDITHENQKIILDFIEKNISHRSSTELYSE